ncbi:hypothetical protein K2173_007348 [Erythroxylum novogranatense]|uniref:SSD domain-containing protein n=1 Tax=Erythroxylum novogranatense TaxID=1862640 RepID=A0AAV8T6G5_9ROSI|nr:hypothetical protein K2173_007348 [Erythroxylum novogranatense]
MEFCRKWFFVLKLLALFAPLTFAGQRHSEGYCSMYDICGARDEGKSLTCPYNVPSTKPNPRLAQKVQSLCPTITGNICCTEAQFDILRSNTQQAVPFLVGCPACLRNFLNLFCEITCSPDRSLFLNVTSVSKIKNNVTVEKIDLYVADTFGEMLFDSCMEVKFGTMNMRAIEFVGGGAQNFTDWFAFLGKRADPNMPGSPFAITFKSTAPRSSRIRPMNVTAYSCSDVSLGCSCGDCPSSPGCKNKAPPTEHAPGSCTVRIGPLKVRVTIYGTFSTQYIQAYKSSKVSIFYHYRSYGTWVVHHRILVLCLSLSVVLVLCVGLIRFKVETRPPKLWVAPGSKAAAEKQFFDSHLAPFYRIEQLILATLPDIHGKSPTIITDENIKLLFDLQRKVDGIRANYSGSMISLTDICLKPLDQNCSTQSILQFFQMDPEQYANYGLDHVQYCLEHYSSDERCLSAFKGPLDPSTALGGFSGNNYSEASAFIVTYPVNNVMNGEGNQIAIASAWEEAFIQLAKDELLPMVLSKNLTLSFSSERSLEDELKRESFADVIAILISYVVMFAYISLILGGAPRLYSFYISSKVLLGLSGVVLVILSVLGSVGFFSAIGVKSTLIIMEVIPFLVLAVGVDNMCILVHAVKRQPLELPLEGRISNALVEVGPSITLASLSEVSAFAVGASVIMPACRVFSMFAALAVLLDFFLQVTVFVALISLDCSRASDNRVDCFPCFKVSSSITGSDAGTTGEKPGLIARYMKNVHAQILGLLAVKITVIAIFVAFALASAALTTRVQPGLEQQTVLPKDSYLQGYFQNVSEYLRMGAPLYFVVKNYNYSSESTQTNNLCSISQCNSNSLLNEIARASMSPKSTYIAKPAASWLDDFLVWISPEAYGCCREFANGTYCPPNDQPPCCAPDTDCVLSGECKDCTTCFLHSELNDGRPSTLQFKQKLPWFLNALPSSDCSKGGHGAYTTSLDLRVSLSYEDGVIRASSFRTYHTPLNTQADFINSIRAAREFSSRMSDSLKIRMPPSVVFVVCLIFTLSFWSSAIILLVLVMIIVDMMGVMAILGIQLNAISVVNLVMAVGIGIEFCVHITHAYMISVGTRDQRVREALGTMGASVLSGITLTKLVGVVVLQFSMIQIFVIYCFKMYMSLVLLGFLHGLMFLPIRIKMKLRRG